MCSDASGSGKTVKTNKSQTSPRPQLPLKVTLTNTQRDLPLSMPRMKEVVSLLIAHLKIGTDEVIIHFITDSKMRKLHKEFFDDPSPTDCITFPLDGTGKQGGMAHVLGEAFICPKTAQLFASMHKIDPFEELCRYIAHCLLHMIGYDDQTPKDRARMKRAEGSCLRALAKLL